MSFRIATFNVENMFERPKALNLPTWADGREILNDFATLNDLIGQDSYTTARKTKMLDIMGKYPGLLTQGHSQFIRLREYRGKLCKGSGANREILPNRRDDWIGWFELVPDQVNSVALSNTARIVTELGADILCVVEADNRSALLRFNEDVLPTVGGSSFEHVMLVDGNDSRGIDLGLMTGKKYPIVGMASHVYDRDSQGIIFSRDCAEYHVSLPSGERLILLLNHYKSKGFGSQATSNAKRNRQAKRTRHLYEQRRTDGFDLVCVLGDLNDTPDSEPLKPLLMAGSDLIDAFDHAAFQSDGRPGTHGNGTAAAKLDYLLMSPALSDRCVATGVNRRGVWGGKHGTLFPHLPEVTKDIEAASDHAAIWAEIS